MTPYPWQSDTWNEFEQKITLAKVPHAMLFVGPQGVGKLPFAKAFVHRLFCHDLQQGYACGVCDACHLLSIGNHPDFYHIAKLEDKKDISVDQIRDLISYANLKPHSAPRKVAIIEQAELMNVAASNSLLKTLEEPPESSAIILITHRPDRLLPTIRSRCQLQQFVHPKTEIALPWLKSKLNNPTDAEKLLAIANGAPLQALTYAETDMLAQREQMFSGLKALIQGEENPINIATRYLKMDLDMTLYCVSSWLMDMIRLKVDPKPPVLGNPDLQPELLKISQQSSLPKMLEYYDFVINLGAWRQGNINTQLILEELLVRWSDLNKLEKA